MAIFARRRPNPESVATVETWGEEPIGAAQVDALMARRGADMAGFTAPTPAGWGLAGCQETTDMSLYASPQAFNAGGAKVALSTWSFSNDRPRNYPQDAAMAQIVLPNQNGI